MLSLPSAQFRAAHLVSAVRLGGLAGIALLVGSVIAPPSATQALAQAAGCGDIQKMLLERKALAASLSPKKGQKLEAKFACGQFGKLVANGNTLIKWVDTNKDWCQIPDSFIGGIKTDHSRATAIRVKACSVAAQMQKMEKQAKEGGGSAGLLGGGGLEGQTKLPQGAL
jgi:hypothetical protein